MNQTNNKDQQKINNKNKSEQPTTVNSKIANINNTNLKHIKKTTDDELSTIKKSATRELQNNNKKN